VATADDRDDLPQPASVLLERIRAERRANDGRAEEPRKGGSSARTAG